MLNLNDFRHGGFSQNAKDGITEKIFELIGVTNKISVEIGVGDGNQCCSRILWQDKGFTGFMFDCNHEDPKKNLAKAFVTSSNVLEILDSKNIPLDIDFLGVDIDSQDFYVVHTILTKYAPRLLVVETNPTFIRDDKVVDLGRDCDGHWAYHGAGLAAWFNSLNPLGYRLVCHEWNGINAFFVKDGLLPSHAIKDYNSMELFSEHEGKPGCSLSNYSAYPPSYPVVTSEEALRKLREVRNEGL